ncbi:type I toxin-antitoxin system Ibs family toxin [Escherichia coli]
MMKLVIILIVLLIVSVAAY